MDTNKCDIFLACKTCKINKKIEQTVWKTLHVMD